MGKVGSNLDYLIWWGGGGGRGWVLITVDYRGGGGGRNDTNIDYVICQRLLTDSSP